LVGPSPGIQTHLPQMTGQPPRSPHPPQSRPQIPFGSRKTQPPRRPPKEPPRFQVLAGLDVPSTDSQCPKDPLPPSSRDRRGNVISHPFSLPKENFPPRDATVPSPSPPLLTNIFPQETSATIRPSSVSLASPKGLVFSRRSFPERIF